MGLTVKTCLVLVAEKLVANTACSGKAAIGTNITNSVADSWLGHLGIANSFGVEIIISITNFHVHIFWKSKKYINNIEEYKKIFNNENNRFLKIYWIWF